MCRGLLSQPGMRCLWSSYRRTTAATTSACTLSTSSGAGSSHCFTAELAGVLQPSAVPSVQRLGAFMAFAESHKPQ